MWRKTMLPSTTAAVVLVDTEEIGGSRTELTRWFHRQLHAGLRCLGLFDGLAPLLLGGHKAATIAGVLQMAGPGATTLVMPFGGSTLPVVTDPLSISTG